MNNFYTLAEELTALSEKVPKVFTEAKEAELAYMNKWDELAMATYEQYGSQALRDSHTRKAITVEETINNNYHVKTTEKSVLEMQIKIKLTVARLITTSNFNENTTGVR